VADQTERDGRNSRAQNRARADVQQLRRDNRHERRRQRDQKRADTYADDSQRSCPLFGACPIDQPTAGHLAQKASEAADGQDEPDIDLRPFLGREVDRQEGAEPRLDVGNEEGEPIEAAQARS
jgi:hypothetical protein